MELYEEVENNTNQKSTKIIVICIAILLIITIIIIGCIVYLQKTVTKITIDGQANYDIENVIYVKEENKEKLYFAIREVAKYFGYEDYRGDYRVKSEDPTKCYVKNEFEVAMFTKDSNILVTTNSDLEYQSLILDENVFEKDGELYTTEDGIEKAFCLSVDYNLKKNSINIFTMDYLNNYWAKQRKIDGEKEVISDKFSDRKAIFEDMIVYKKDQKYGVVNASTGQSILETKYEEIKFLPTTTDFLVKSNEKYGIMGKDGLTKVRAAYDEIKVMDNKNGLYLVKQNNLYGVINGKGNIIIPLEHKQIGIDLSKYERSGVENSYVLLDEVIPIKNNQELWALYNLKGEKIRDFEFNDIGCIPKTTNSSNSYSALVIPSYKIIIVKKGDKYNLMTTKGEELVSGYILDSIYMKTNTETGENKFFMTYNNNVEAKSVEEWLASIGR